jgi:uncharacterized protein YbcI
MSDSQADAKEVKEEIARELSQVHEESYGQRASNLDVAIHSTFIAVTMDIELSPAEVVLIDAGNPDSVKITREAFQEAIEPTFKAIVERATGRTVRSFASRTILDEDGPWSVEVFRLEAPSA